MMFAEPFNQDEIKTSGNDFGMISERIRKELGPEKSFAFEAINENNFITAVELVKNSIKVK